MSDDTYAVSRGARARIELEQTEKAMAGLRQAALEEIIVTPPEQLAKRERLIICAQVIDALREALQKTVDAGTIANHRLALAEQNLLRP